VLLLKNAQVWSGKGDVRADVLVDGGKIVALGTSLETSYSDVEAIDLSGKWLFPGVIDSQVHFREPGLIHKEDIATGSKAALLGGVTTFLEMPNTTPPTTSIAALGEKLAIAQKTSYVNYGFFIGATADNLHELKEARHQEGCCGIKIFLGSSTGDLLLYDEFVLREIFLQTDLPISIHSEDEERLRERVHLRDQGRHPEDHLVWRDEEVALRSTKMIVELARRCQRKIHMLHISSKSEIEFLDWHKDIVTVEVTPQHLTLAAPECYNDLGSLAQMNPPIRSAEHREALWQGVKKEVVDVIGSDHAPHTLEEKSKPYPASPSGMPGVQTLLPVMLHHLDQGRLSVPHLVSLLCERPAQIFSLANKGYIRPGYDADITIVDPCAEYVITHASMASKTGWTPYDGLKVKGGVWGVIVGGEVAMMDGKVVKAYEDHKHDVVSKISRMAMSTV